MNISKIFKYSDIICLHLNFTQDQENFINKKTLNLMKKELYFNKYC